MVSEILKKPAPEKGNKLKQIVKKLKKMRAAEINFRVRKKVFQEIDFLRYSIQKNSGSRYNPKLKSILNIGKFDKNKLTDYFPNTTYIKFFSLDSTQDSNIKSFLNIFPNAKQNIIDDANKILQNKFYFLGSHFELQDPVAWTCDPQSGKPFDQNFFTKVEIFNSEEIQADVKYVWELNRHQFFIELAKAYYLTGEEKYAEKFYALFESWVEANPYKTGVNWTSALETAVRIYAWTWSYYFTRHASIWTEERIEKFLIHLYRQAAFTEENLSYYFSPYNHLIGEIAALSFLGTAFPQYKSSKRWQEKYWQMMESELEKQFYPDGLSVEQATYYHHFTVGFYIQNALLRKMNDLPVSQKTWNYFEHALEISMNLTKPDGTLPMIGDIDSARSIYFYQPQKQWDLRTFLCMGAVLFGRHDMKKIGGVFSEDAFWLFGTNGKKTFDSLQTRSPQYTSRSFEKSGYFIMRDGWEKNSNYMNIDCGEIADGLFKDDTSSVAHGHGDILSFDLCVNGKSIIGDPGFYTYNGVLEWHRYFRSTRGHNTIEIDGFGQGKHEGRMGWSQVSSPHLNQWLTNSEFDFFDGQTDRFAEIEISCFHRRRIFFLKNKFWFILDEVIGEKTKDEHDIKSYLHFTPGEVKIDNKNNRILCRQFTDVISDLYLTCTESFEINFENASRLENPASGWYCSGYGVREPASVVSISSKTKLPFQVAMFVAAEDLFGNNFKFSTNDKNKNENQFFYRIGNAHQEYLFFAGNEKLTVSESVEILTNASFIVVEIINNNWKNIYMVNVSKVKINDRYIFNEIQKIAELKIINSNGKTQIVIP